jgi:hypothetical protein
VDASDALDWARQFGTTRYDLAYATATSGSGVYAAGFTNFALTGQQYHRRYDAFVRKYDVDGEVLWTRQFGSSGTDQALALAADDGGVTVVGSTDGRIVKQEAAGGVDAFVARFGSAGGLHWIHQFGTRADDRATAVGIGTDGTFVAGTTGGALGDRRAGPSDAFVARVDASSGGLAWVRQFGGDGAEEANGIAVRARRAYVVGSTIGKIGGADLGGTSDGLVAAFRSSGAPLWRRAIGTDGADRLTAVVARARGLFVSGSTGGTLEGQSPSGGLDAFVGKLGLDGGEVWFRQFGSPTDDEAVAIAAAAKGLYVAGSTSGALPDGTALGEWDGFVRKYLPNGTQLWTRQLGTADYDRVNGLSLEGTGLYLAGTTHGAFEGELNAGDRDAFLVRLAFS